MHTAIKSLMLCLVVTYALPVFAEVRITEIMYDRDGTDSGYEWIEVFNDGEESVNLPDWSFVESGTNHRIEALSDASLPPDTYAVIADDPTNFSEDFGDYDGVIYDSAFSLSNEGEELILRDGDGTTVHSVTYDPAIGAAGDGASLQWQEGTEWIAGLPTPGEQNTSEVYSEPEEDDDEDVQDEESDIVFESPESEWPFDKEVFVHAGANRRAFVDSPIEFSADARWENGDEVDDTSFQWVFGDGNADRGEHVEHSFGHTGRYNVTLITEVDGEEFRDRAIIHVLEPEFSIAEVRESSVTIENNVEHEMDVGGWQIDVQGEREREEMIFPDDTYLLPETDLTLDIDIPQDLENVALRNIYGDAIDNRTVSSQEYREKLNAHLSRIDELFDRLDSFSN